MSAPRTILVTHALPYANGPLHIGHLLGYIQSDIWVRAQRMAGNTVHFVAADDVHGTPIMLAAEKAGLAPEDFIKGMQISHEADFRDFGVAHDYYYTTHSPENRELAEMVYRRLRDADPSHVTTRAVRQFYDPLKQMFLPDRYIKGECPNCGTADQYGDNCENCGATYAPTDLKNPRSVVSGATPELRDSEHYFFKLGDFTAFLRDWFAGKFTGGEPVAHSSVAAKLKEWLDADGGLRDWDISRDAPYFGFPIPDAPGKFFYVWLDAPIGYLASFKKYCASDKGVAAGLSPAYFDEFMSAAGSSALSPQPSALHREMHHFLGKDIINFHGLFWPAMLKGAALRDIPPAMDAGERPPPAGSAQQDPGMVRPGFERLGHLPRRALLRLRDPGRARQILLRLARRADRVPRQLQTACKSNRARLRKLHRRRIERRARALHRQGHTLFPRVVLAGDAQVFGPSHAEPRLCPRLPHRQRREDV